MVALAEPDKMISEVLHGLWAGCSPPQQADAAQSAASVQLHVLGDTCRLDKRIAIDWLSLLFEHKDIINSDLKGQGVLQKRNGI